MPVVKGTSATKRNSLSARRRNSLSSLGINKSPQLVTNETTSAKVKFNQSPPKASYCCENGVKLDYNGVKYFWKNRLTVDVYIFRHENSTPPIYEIICYNPKLYVEAPRIYCSVPSVLECIEPSEIERRINEKKEAFLRRKNEFSLEDLTEEAISENVAKFLTTRIIEADAENKYSFQVALAPLLGDKVSEDNTSKLQFIVEKPENLHAQAISFPRKST